MIIKLHCMVYLVPEIYWYNIKTCENLKEFILFGFDDCLYIILAGCTVWQIDARPKCYRLDIIILHTFCYAHNMNNTLLFKI